MSLAKAKVPSPVGPPWLPTVSTYKCGTPGTGWAQPMNVGSLGSSVWLVDGLTDVPGCIDIAPPPPSYTATRKLPAPVGPSVVDELKLIGMAEVPGTPPEVGLPGISLSRNESSTQM